MARLCRLVLGTVLFHTIVFYLLSTAKGDEVTPPENVHFQTDFFHHILVWTHQASDPILYQVEYLRYGSSWIAVDHCNLISHQSCDLTVQTLPKSQGYFARVRSVLGNHSSEWARSLRYTFKEVTLPPPSVQLILNGSGLYVQLSLPEIRVRNFTKRFEDFFPFNRMYTVQIQRTSDGHMFEQVKQSENFLITGLVGGHEYCLVIQPSISSRDNTWDASSERCIYVPEEGDASSTLLLVASCILTVIVMLIFVNIIICLYTKRVVKTPETLMTLMKRSWSWMDKPPSPVIETTLCWDSDLTKYDLIPVNAPRDSQTRSSADSGFGSQIVVIQVPQSIPVLLDPSLQECVERSEGDSTSFLLQKDIAFEKQNSQDEDSGIILSTESTRPQCHSGCDDSNAGDTQSCGSSQTAEIVVRQGYLRQQGSEQNSNYTEDEEHAWPNDTKDYLSQRPQTVQNSHDEHLHQEKCELFTQPWIAGPFQPSLPLTTVTFSPFKQTLCGIGDNVLSLVDVKLMDTGS